MAPSLRRVRAHFASKNIATATPPRPVVQLLPGLVFARQVAPEARPRFRILVVVRGGARPDARLGIVVCGGAEGHFLTLLEGLFLAFIIRSASVAVKDAPAELGLGALGRRAFPITV